MIFGNQCCSAYPDCLHAFVEGDEPVCDHENAETCAEGRGEAWHCSDCGARGFNTYATMYGVSDADFI